MISQKLNVNIHNTQSLSKVNAGQFVAHWPAVDGPAGARTTLVLFIGPSFTDFKKGLIGMYKICQKQCSRG